jgi:hypothetical protein
MILLQRPKKNQPQSNGLVSCHKRAYFSVTAAELVEVSEKGWH